MGAKEVFGKVSLLYRDKFMHLDLYNDTYDSLCILINTETPAILEIGCGPGNITKYLFSKIPSAKILATDFAPEMIQIAQQENPAADCRVMDCRNIAEINQKFDALISGFCIPYLSAEECRLLFRDASTLLNKNGLFYLSFIEGDYNQSGSETGSTGDRVFVYYYSETQMSAMLQESGFSIVRVFRKRYAKSAEVLSSHLIIIARIA